MRFGAGKIGGRKDLYVKQAARNLENVRAESQDEQIGLFEAIEQHELTPEEEDIAIDEERRAKMIRKSHQGC